MTFHPGNGEDILFDNRRQPECDVRRESTRAFSRLRAMCFRSGIMNADNFEKMSKQELIRELKKVADSS